MKFKVNLYFLIIFLSLIIDNYAFNSELNDNLNVFRIKRESRYSRTDNRKPAFLNCKGYSPKIKEEQPVGAPVIQVKAYDPDEKDKLEYNLITTAAGRKKFKIDKKTGQIVTDHRFDRDEPIREKEFYVTVRASDNGHPPLDDVCTFKVTIEDINDNSPEFDRIHYDESMAEDTLVGKFVLRVSASDLDDGNNSIVVYNIPKEKDFQYFEIDKNTGDIKLIKSIDKQPGQYYSFNVEASNIVPDSQTSKVSVKLRVIESHKKSPYFFPTDQDVIYIKENYNDFSIPLATIGAVSNIPDKPEVVFELISGKTEQTNSKKTFVLQQSGTNASIMLGKHLDYEQIVDYTLTLSVKNSWDLSSLHTIKVKVEDVNDNIPYFIEITNGVIPENEPPNTPVMQVRAFDMDGTAANNIVSFELDASSLEFFEIDRHTGNVTALISFDREERDSYNIKVIASDNSPSALYNNNEPNRGEQTFQINIADKNDHSPKFNQSEYISENLAEDTNINHIVIVLTAVDNDTASQIEYTIVAGNEDGAFKIEKSTGKITVAKKLDYEKITKYDLKIRAFDGLYEDFARVVITIENINDEPPVFDSHTYNTTLQEETIPEGCIVQVSAWDPDIKNRNEPQNIQYVIVKDDEKKLFKFDNDGCLRLVSKLDRDPPNGYQTRQILITAIDENGNGNSAAAYVYITLTDINDNAPFLTVPSPIIWYENRPPGEIIRLTADDYDEINNGAPFYFKIDDNASNDIKQKFRITGDILYALVEFDREENKKYIIPISITDSGEPQQSGVSELVLIIGDENDNKMKDGESSIFVYNYKGDTPSTEIGRVYVDDPDDWDLPDKYFQWLDGIEHDYYRLNESNGMITMLEKTPADFYTLKFMVSEESHRIPRHSVTATVFVEIKEIPEEAVDKSGSIRFNNITAEEFVSTNGGLSYKDRFQSSIAELFNISKTNVDVFTVLKNYNSSFLDVRYSAHGSPYYEAVRLNGKVAQNQQMLEKELGLSIYMVNIDECLIEKQMCPETSCVNVLHKSSTPLLVYTNTTSFVGVNAFIQPECECRRKLPIVCLNGGTRYDEACECLEGYDGPYCEVLSVGFHGDGYGLYPSMNPCDSSTITLEIVPRVDSGLILYIGPMHFNPNLKVQDFLSFELNKGYPILNVDYGTGTTRIEHKNKKLELGVSYQIDINLQKNNIEMLIDNCRNSTCMSFSGLKGPNEYLNVNSPIHVGGTSVDLEMLAKYFKWDSSPKNQGFNGCVKKLVIDGVTYNLGEPELSKNHDRGCNNSVAVAVSFGIDTNFLIAILTCTIILILLLLVLVVRKKKQDPWPGKDIDDIRETIINYEDEGGGERDTDYDLNVLASPIYEDRPYRDLKLLQQNPHEVPDIGGFLVDKKDSCDRDNDAYPLDDVRHYAYEGDGNSTGSLSSLASCTDDGDLKFDHLSNFGPRFRKLADMYGEEPSDIDSNVDGDEGWRR